MTPTMAARQKERDGCRRGLDSLICATPLGHAAGAICHQTGSYEPPHGHETQRPGRLGSM